MFLHASDSAISLVHDTSDAFPLTFVKVIDTTWHHSATWIRVISPSTKCETAVQDEIKYFVQIRHFSQQLSPDFFWQWNYRLFGRSSMKSAGGKVMKEGKKGISKAFVYCSNLQKTPSLFQSILDLQISYSLEWIPTGEQWQKLNLSFAILHLKVTRDSVNNGWNLQKTGHFQSLYQLEWTLSYGRVVDNGSIAVVLRRRYNNE